MKEGIIIKVCEICGHNKDVHRHKVSGKMLCRDCKESLETNRNVCEICGGTYRVYIYKDTNQFLCSKHRTQLIRRGKILEKTIHDPNDIIIYNDYAEVIINDNKNNIKGVMLISLESIELIKKYKINLLSNGYCTTNINRKVIKIHRLIVNANESEHVDHIDGNKLNNQLSNLRKCTKTENSRNRININSNNSSGISGVSWNKFHGKWAVWISDGQGNQIHLGFFINLKEAVDVRLKAEKMHYKEFAPKFKNKK